MPGWFWILFWWLAFAASHLGLSSIPVRQRIIGRLGEQGFRGLYSLASIVTFVLLVRSYWRNEDAGPELWGLESPVLIAISVLLTAIAFVLAAQAFAQPSPVSLRPGGLLRAHGATRITRHPLFCGIGVWALGHLLINGHLSELLFFGGFILFVLAGAAHQDARKRASGSEALRAFYEETSLLPFGAILAGRNHLALDELSRPAMAIGLGVAAVLYALHYV